MISQIKKRYGILFETGWTLAAQILLTILNTVLVFSLANLLSPHDFGQFKFITTWGAIAFGIGYTGYVYIVSQKFAKNEVVFLGSLYKSTLKKSWYVFLILFIASLYYLLNENLLLALGFFLTMLTTTTTLLSPLASGFYIGKRKIVLNTNILILISSFQVCSVLLTTYIFQNIYLTVSVYLLSFSIGHFFNIIYAYKKSKADLGTVNISEKELKYELDSANKLNLSSIVSTFAYNSDRLLLFHFVGAVELAIYSISIAISDQLRAPFKSLSSVILPRLATTQNAKSKALITFYLVSFISMIICCVFYFVNPYIFQYFFPKYINYVYLANLSLFSILFSGTSIFLTYLQSQKDFDSLNNNTIIMVILMLTLYPIAAYSKSLELFVIFRNVVVFSCSLYVFYRFYKIKV